MYPFLPPREVHIPGCTLPPHPGRHIYQDVPLLHPGRYIREVIPGFIPLREAYREV